MNKNMLYSHDANLAAKAARANKTAELAYDKAVIESIVSNYVSFKVNACQDATNAAFTALTAANAVVNANNEEERQKALSFVVVADAAVTAADIAVKAVETLYDVVDRVAYAYASVPSIETASGYTAKNKDVIDAVETAFKAHADAVIAILATTVYNKKN